MPVRFHRTHLWFTRQNTTIFCLCAISVSFLADDWWCPGQWEFCRGQCMGSILIEGSSVCRLRTERHFALNQWSLAACRCPFRMRTQYGRWACAANRPIWLCMVCVEILALWHPGVSTTFLVDGLHWFHRCLQVVHTEDDCRWGQSLANDATTTDFFCVAHWNVVCYLLSSSWLPSFGGYRQFKLIWQARNAKFDSKSVIVCPKRPWNLTENLEI